MLFAKVYEKNAVNWTHNIHFVTFWTKHQIKKISYEDLQLSEGIKNKLGLSWAKLSRTSQLNSTLNEDIQEWSRLSWWRRAKQLYIHYMDLLTSARYEQGLRWIW